MMNSFQSHLHQKALYLSKTFQKTEFELIDILQKIHEAKVFLALGYNSLYLYAHEGLGLSEANSYAFTAVAKKANQVPELKAEIKSGKLSVSKAKRLIPVITVENKKEWLEKAVTLPKAALERSIAEANPEGQKRESLRPISNDRFSLKLGISQDLVRKLKRAQVLLMNKSRKNLNLEQTLEFLTEEFLKKNDPVEKAQRLGSGPKREKEERSGVVKGTGTPLKGSTGPFHPRKSLPAQVKHAVFLRDKGQCQFQYESKKCGGVAYIEIHHEKPVAKGGGNLTENLVTLCSRHHKHAHELGRTP